MPSDPTSGRISVVCPYCGNPAKLVTGKEVYPHRWDLHPLRFYLCRPCRAHVGCHRGTIVPLGRLANAELRAAKMEAHAKFDPSWQSGQMTRTEAYAWLSRTLGLPPAETHIAMFDLDMCRKILTLEIPR